MKTLFAAIILSLAMGLAPEAEAQVRWGVDIHLGSPPPPPPLRREIIVERPCADATWVPGYWRYERYHRHYTWVAGYWNRPHYVYRERERWHRDRDYDRDFDRGRGRGNGRIRGGWR